MERRMVTEVSRGMTVLITKEISSKAYSTARAPTTLKRVRKPIEAISLKAE